MKPTTITAYPVMLPTDKASTIWLSGKTLCFGRLTQPKSFAIGNKAQHLCLTSDEKPKVGDWYIKKELGKESKVIQLTVDGDFLAKKVIATTDRDLQVGVFKDISNIPQSFIKQWVESNGTIESVEVEYRRMYKTERGSTFECKEGECPTFNHTKEWKEPKTTQDNCVIIHQEECSNELHHTKGEWMNTTDGEANFYGVSTNSNWLFRIQQNGELMPREQEANAKLIASAPELLEACISIESLYSEAERIIDGDVKEMVDKVREAIKKATL